MMKSENKILLNEILKHSFNGQVLGDK